MTPEQLKLADKIEGWSPEKWKPLTLIAHERRLAVAALRATPDARVKEALFPDDEIKDGISMSSDAAYNLEGALYDLRRAKSKNSAPDDVCINTIARVIGQLEAARAALSHQPGTGEADGSLQGMIRAVYGECDAEDCAFVDREWAKLRGYILPTDGTSTIAKSPALDTLADLVSRFADALLKKLRLAQANGRGGWDRDDWEKQCQEGLLRHVEKGDPRDVAAYCAFMWHHGWITKSPALDTATVEAAFLNLCEALGIPATAAAYLDAPKARAALAAKEGA